MKKRIFAIVMAVIMVTTLFIGAIPAMAANDGGVTIRIHYHRPEGDYEGWELWAWDLDGNYKVSGTLATDGSASNDPPFKFEPNGDEVVATINVPTGTMRVGYIARYGNWEKKDIEWDQFINITGILSGTVDFYIESGIQTQADGKDKIPTMEALCNMEIEYNGKPQKVMVLGDDVVKGTVVTSANYEVDKNGDPRITVMVSSEPETPIDLNSFIIKGQNGKAASVASFKKIQTTYYLYLDQELPLDKAFVIEYEGNDYAIKMPDYYSTNEFESKYTYDGNDLGQTYSKDKTTLKLWAPLAASVQVYLYKNGNPAEQEEPDEKIDMTYTDKGVWEVTLNGDKNGTYYTYYVDNVSKKEECVDPYARAVGVNGRRGMIIDLASTNPDGWDTDKDPHYDDAITDAVIWELHVRDLTSDASSGVKEEWRGKYLGLIQAGTTNNYNQATGLDYIKNLGITHIHLLPVYDFGSVDENRVNDKDANLFNWGYDPMNYNVPEGSYSTDPYNGEVRVKEFKQMVKGLHDNGISVIMDVVYNHVYDGAKFCMNNTVPNYFSRPSGSGSGCGNDTASERSMVRKYIVDSVNYWADEYHIDGFRFDLAGVLDTVTINEIVKTVQEKHPNVIFYGEGWTSGGVEFTKPGMTQAVMANSSKTPGFAYFSDTIRNTLKGGTFGGVSAGYISGGSSNGLNACFKGMPDWCTTPTQSINYVSAHDNNTLYDHITLVKPQATYDEKCDITKLGVAFYMAAQGVPFIHAGEEMNRSKPSDPNLDANNGNAGEGFFHNSYNAPDRVNSLKWDLLYDQPTVDVLEYYQGMIAFRKAHPALRLTTASDVNTRVTNLTGLPSNVLGYQIKAEGVEGETAKNIICLYNATANAAEITLPEGEWTICVNKDQAGIYSLGTVSGKATVESVGSLILVQGGVQDAPVVENPGQNPGATDSTVKTTTKVTANWILAIGIWAAVAVIGVVGAILLLKKK